MLDNASAMIGHWHWSKSVFMFSFLLPLLLELFITRFRLSILLMQILFYANKDIIMPVNGDTVVA